MDAKQELVNSLKTEIVERHSQNEQQAATQGKTMATTQKLVAAHVFRVKQPKNGRVLVDLMPLAYARADKDVPGGMVHGVSTFQGERKEIPVEEAERLEKNAQTLFGIKPGTPVPILPSQSGKFYRGLGYELGFQWL